MPERSQIIIIGNGAAGITAARHLRKLGNDHITVISAETPFHYARPGLMYAFMGQLEHRHLQPYADDFWKANRIDLLHDTVVKIDAKGQCLTLANGETRSYDKLLLATGSRGRRGGWAGEDLRGVQRFTSMHDLALLEQNVVGVQHAAVIGGGLTAIEVAEMLRSRSIAVTMIMRDEHLAGHLLPNEESIIIERHVQRHGVSLRCGTEVVCMRGGANGRVSQLELSDGTTLDVQLVVTCIGVEPVTELARDAGLDVRTGIVVNDRFETSMPNVYAAGDCAEHANGLLELSWYAAKSHGEHVARTIHGDAQPYRRGIPFDAAKFFDIEYQSYGIVDAQAFASWTWAPPDGHRFVRIAYDARTCSVVGIHALGVRLRADVCTAWVERGTHVDEVLHDIRKACFDPELYLTPQQLHEAATRGRP